MQKNIIPQATHDKTNDHIMASRSIALASKSMTGLIEIVDDQTICELEDPPRRETVLFPSEKPNQRAEETRSRSLGTGTITAIVFGTISALVLGYVGLQSSMTSSSQLTSSQQSIKIELDPKEAQERLEHLRQSVTTKNLEALDKLSVMSEDRRNWLEGLFRNYITIEASLGEIVSTPTDITSTLRIEKLILPNGEAFPVGPALQKIRLTIAREGNAWGKIQW